MHVSNPRRMILAALVALAVLPVCAWGEVSGKALLTDAATRVKPGNLILCTLLGGEKKFETIVTGNVIDARFSPDGTQVVFGLDHKIKTMNLATRAVQEVGAYTSDFTYFTWCQDDKIYYSDGKDLTEIFGLDLKTKAQQSVFKGNGGRSTVSLDGKCVAWVMPPVCAVLSGGKGQVFRYMGGCGGAVSPSGKYLTSNLTTTHKLMGIFSLGENGPSPKPIAYVKALANHAINGFHFGRSDDWVCYTVEAPEKISPISYICYWRTDEHVEIGPKYCIKDFFDETDVVPAGAQLEKIVVCAPGPSNTPIVKETVNVGMAKDLKVVGYFTSKKVTYTPQLRDGIAWKANGAQIAVTATSYKGVAACEQTSVTAEYKGKTCSFETRVLPELTGDGFKAEFFQDTTFSKKVFERVDAMVDFRWDGASSPDASVNGKLPWSVAWTGMLNVQTEGEYTFYFLQGEGNDRNTKGDGGQNIFCYGAWIDGQPLFPPAKGNYPWATPRASAKISLSKGMHAIKAISIDASAFPVVAQLLWSGPGIKQSLLGSPYVYANLEETAKTPAGK
ncbi:MAG: hypothetical protein KIS92_03870 [Planctomycetota bacterium]|nr:hypothetical protein [Planctomycetota bacterium]